MRVAVIGAGFAGLIETCREHYAKVGLGAEFVDQFIR